MKKIKKKRGIKRKSEMKTIVFLIVVAIAMVD